MKEKNDTTDYKQQLFHLLSSELNGYFLVEHVANVVAGLTDWEKCIWIWEGTRRLKTFMHNNLVVKVKWGLKSDFFSRFFEFDPVLLLLLVNLK